MTKATDDQQELFKADFGWFPIFREMIRNGTWSKMSLAAKAVYPVVKSFANKDSGAAFPSYDTIATHSGLSLQSVSKALKELAACNLLATKRVTGRRTEYSVTENFKVQHPLSKQEVTATAPYASDHVKAMVDELKAFVATGVKGKIIQINFNMNCGDIHTTGINMEHATITTSTKADAAFEEIERILG